MNTSTEKERRVNKCTDLYLFKNEERFNEALLIPDLFNSSSRNRYLTSKATLPTSNKESTAN